MPHIRVYLFCSPVEEKARIQQLMKLYGQPVEFDEFGNIVPNSDQSNTDLHDNDQDKQQDQEFSMETTSWSVAKETATDVSTIYSVPGLNLQKQHNLVRKICRDFVS